MGLGPGRRTALRRRTITHKWVINDSSKVPGSPGYRATRAAPLTLIAAAKSDEVPDAARLVAVELVAAHLGGAALVVPSAAAHQHVGVDAVEALDGVFDLERKPRAVC